MCPGSAGHRRTTNARDCGYELKLAKKRWIPKESAEPAVTGEVQASMLASESKKHWKGPDSLPFWPTNGTEGVVSVVEPPTGLDPPEAIRTSCGLQPDIDWVSTMSDFTAAPALLTRVAEYSSSGTHCGSLALAVVRILPLSVVGPTPVRLGPLRLSVILVAGASGRLLKRAVIWVGHSPPSGWFRRRTSDPPERCS